MMKLMKKEREMERKTYRGQTYFENLSGKNAGNKQNRSVVPTDREVVNNV